MNIICFGARENEQPFFHALNKYGYKLTLIPELLTEANVDLIQGHKTVLLRGNCDAKKNNLLKMKEMGVEYLLTRTVGVDHIDLTEAHQLGFKMARVPGYSPNAIAELALSLAMMLLRNTARIVSATSRGDFRVLPSYFSREMRNMTVGIVGVGKIGQTAAKLFKGMGARVLGYDIHESPEAKEILEFVSLEKLGQESNIVTLHIPYIKDQNYHLINQRFINSMPPESIIVNVARGEILDLASVLQSIKTGHLSGFGSDVLEDESLLFNKDLSGKPLEHPLFAELTELYPRVLITPHIGSNTDEACQNMIEQSFDNLNDYLTTNDCKNKL